jgi:hypothetical protein
MPKQPKRITTLTPITLAGFKNLLKRFGYDCSLDAPPVLQFKKDGKVPLGFEHVSEYWEDVLTWRYPDYHSEKHNELVYNISEVLDFIQKIVMVTDPGVDRTELAIEIRKVIATKEKEKN